MWWIPTLVLCCGVALIVGQEDDYWVKTVYNEYGETVTFSCVEPETDTFPGHPEPDNDGSGPWVNATVEFWLAYLDVVGINQTLDDNIVVDASGWNLTVKNVTKKDFGVYHCVMKTMYGETYMVKWGLNMRGPYFEDLWDEYRLNTIIGLSSMLGFLVLCAFIFLVYHYRWRDPEDVQLEEEQKQAYVSQGFINGYGGKDEIINAYAEIQDDTEMVFINKGLSSDENQYVIGPETTVVNVEEADDKSSAVQVYQHASNAQPLPEPEDVEASIHF